MAESLCQFPLPLPLLASVSALSLAQSVPSLSFVCSRSFRVKSGVEISRGRELVLNLYVDITTSPRGTESGQHKDSNRTEITSATCSIVKRQYIMDDSEYESVLFIAREVYVYRIPARVSAEGYKAADWGNM